MNDHVLKAPRSLIRVFLFAEYQIVLETLRRFVDSNRDMKVVATSGGSDKSDEEPAVLANAEFDVGVVYVSKREQIQLVSRLAETNPGCRTVVVADPSDLDLLATALELGAVGIVQKNQNSKFLIEAIRQTHAGETWLNQVLLHRILEKNRVNGKRATPQVPVDDTDSLTARELEVIRMIGDGLNNKDLAKRLKISEATVRHHLSSIYGKLGVEDRVNMVIFAHEKGLIRYTS